MALKSFVSRSFLIVLFSIAALAEEPVDHIRELQNQAIEQNQAEWGHWGIDPQNYTAWGTHSNRLIPVYTYGLTNCGVGIGLEHYVGEKSLYRSPEKIEERYGRLPEMTFNPDAEYCDQTDIGLLQINALKAGKKHIFLLVFDGMDWQTTQAASIFRNQAVTYESGIGQGLYFQDYNAGGSARFGVMVTAPAVESMKVDLKKQTVVPKEEPVWGGYSARLGGAYPWSEPLDRPYLIGQSASLKHAYPDSAATATSMVSGVKTFNGSIGIDVNGDQVTTVAHLAQRMGYGVGVVSSVPISHATPGAAYAHNVSRNDYHEIARDLIGRPSVSHPEKPLPGMDVVLGGGVGDVNTNNESGPLDSLMPSKYVDVKDLKAVSVEEGGRYQVAVRTSGQSGAEVLEESVRLATRNQHRLLGVFGVGQYSGHLPFQTANGDYRPAKGRSGEAEVYAQEDLDENPTLSQLTDAAIRVLHQNKSKFWLLVEAGDVDWANHDNNLDNSIGAVFSGEDAFRVITDWVEKNSSWEDSLIILTADHGHYFFLTQPTALIPEN